MSEPAPFRVAVVDDDSAIRRLVRLFLKRAGYEVVEGRHVNLPGWLGWLVFCRILRRRPTSPTMVKLLDTWMVPAIRWFETRVRIPIGMSVFLVARKPSGATITN